MKILIHKLCATTIIMTMITSTAVFAEGVTTTDANGLASNTRTVTFEGKSDDNIINSITAVAIGVVTSRILLKFKPVPADGYVASAAGAAYIAGELVAAAKYKKASERKEATLTVTSARDKEGQEAQVEILRDLIKNAEDAKKTVKIKSMLQKAAAAGYLAAAGVAVFQQFTEKTAEAGVKGATQSGLLALDGMEKAASSNLSTMSLVPGIRACRMKIQAQQKGFTAWIKNRLKGTGGGSKADELSSTSTVAPVKALVSTPCLPPGEAVNKSLSMVYTPTFNLFDRLETDSATGLAVNSPAYFHKMFLADRENFFESTPTKKSPFEKMIDTVFPEAKAGMAALLGMGAGAAASLLVLDKMLAKTVDVQMHVPARRAIVWVALAAMTMAASKSSDAVAEDIQGQIDKLVPIVAELDSMTKGIKMNAVSEQKIDLASLIKNRANDYKFSESGKETMPCLSTSTSANCTGVTAEYTALSEVQNLDPELAKISTGVVSLGDSLQGTNGLTASSISASDGVTGNANAINRMKEALTRKLTKLNKDKNLGNSDLDSDANKFRDGLKRDVANALKNRGDNPRSLLGSMTGGSGTSAKNPVEEKKDGIIPPKDLEMVLATGSAPGDSAVELKLDADEEKPTLEAATDVKTNNDDLEMAMADINNDKGASIFQIISNRYLKSGYPKLLEEIPKK